MSRVETYFADSFHAGDGGSRGEVHHLIRHFTDMAYVLKYSTIVICCHNGMVRNIFHQGCELLVHRGVGIASILYH